MKPKLKTNLIFLFRLSIGIGLIYLLIMRYLNEDVHFSDFEINYKILSAGIFVIILSFLFSVSKLHIVIAEYVKNIFETGRLFFIGWFFSSFLPTNMGGDVYIMMSLRERVGSLSKTTALVGIQRIVPVILILFYAVLYSILRPGNLLSMIPVEAGSISGKLLYIVLLCAALCSIVVLLIKNKMRVWFNRLLDFIYNFFRSIGNISGITYVKLVILSLVFQVTRMTGIYIILLSMNQQVNILALFFIFSLVAIISMLPISIGALGVQESAIVFGLKLLDVPLHIGISLAFVYRGIFLMFGIIGGIVFVFKKRSYLK